MNRLFPVLLLIVSVTLMPAALQADQSHKEGAATESMSHQDRAGAADMGTHDKPHGGKKMKQQDDWQAQHKEYQNKLDEMNRKLDQKVTAMNSAKGDQKVAAISEVINELVTQRHEFENWFRTLHGKRMQQAGMGRMGMKGRGGMKGCPGMGMGGGMGMSGGMGGQAQGSSDTGSGDPETPMQHNQSSECH